MASDTDLLRAWRGGDAKAGSALFDRHFASVYRFFRTKTEGSIEDLVQETFLACVRGRDRLEADDRFRAYLFGAARHVLYRHFHHRAHREAPLDSSITSLEDLGPTPSKIVGARQEQRLLVGALRRIPIDLQVALELYYFEQMSGPELAAALGVPEGTARSRVRRGLERLQAAVREMESSPALVESTLADLPKWSRDVQALLAAEASAPR